MERSDCTASRQALFANFDAEKYLGCLRSAVEIVNSTMYLAHVINARANVWQKFVKDESTNGQPQCMTINHIHMPLACVGATVPTPLAVCGCSIACEHLSVKTILTFLHRWQMNLHEQSWHRTFHTTKEILFVKLSDCDVELVSQLRDG